MQLKKINPNLQKALIENDFIEANELQQETFSTIKSGVDAVIQSPNGSGKTTTILLNVIQRMEKPVGESTRALVLVQDKEKVLEAVEQFKKLNHYTNLRVFGVHEKGDMDYDKNQISLGIDVLIGTPIRINEMFSSAGFNMTTIKMFVVDDVEEIVGEESLTHFGEYEDDSVFVRNDRLKCDYEILLDQRNYSDVTKTMPHRVEE